MNNRNQQIVLNGKRISETELQETNAKRRKPLALLLLLFLVVLFAGLWLVVGSVFSEKEKNPNEIGVKTEPQQTTIPFTADGFSDSSYYDGAYEAQSNAADEIRQITIPNFVGSIYDSVAHDAYYSEFLHMIKVEQSSTTVPAGQIISQSIGVGVTVAKGTDIILTVSTGLLTFTVPDVSGRTYEEALAILAQQGLVCVRASKYNDGTHAPNTVAETFPLAGETIRQGDTIQVILWS